MTTLVQEGYSPKKMTATGQVFAGAGTVAGFLCTTAGQLALSAAPDSSMLKWVTSTTSL